MEGIKNDADRIVVTERAAAATEAAAAALSVASHLLGHDCGRVGVEGHDPQIQRLAIGGDTNLGSLGGSVARIRLPLHETGSGIGTLPKGLVQTPIEADPLLNAQRLDGRPLGGKLALLRGRYGNRRRERAACEEAAEHGGA